MIKSVVSIVVGGTLMLQAVPAVYGGTGRDHFSHDIRQPGTPEERKIAAERRVPFEVRISRMKALIGRARITQDLDEHSRLLGWHLKEMQYGMEKIERMKHVRTRSDIQRRIDMTGALKAQMAEYLSELRRMGRGATDVQIREMQESMVNIGSMKYVSTNADVKIKTGMMAELLERMDEYQPEPENQAADSSSTEHSSGVDITPVTDSQTQQGRY